MQAKAIKRVAFPVNIHIKGYKIKTSHEDLLFLIHKDLSQKMCFKTFLECTQSLYYTNFAGQFVSYRGAATANALSHI